MRGQWELIGKATDFVAEEMGVALKRSAISPNIRERMDHSCAVVTPHGAIVAQAEHIPVHLGSFKVGVRNLLEWMARESIHLRPDEMMVVNDPYVSGTHLNDVMVLAPAAVRGKVVALVVNKAHHVDIGGPVPGSLNPSARSLYAEGVVIPPTKLVRGYEVDHDLFAVWAANVRDPATSFGDLNAQVAANLRGADRIRRLIERFGARAVRDGWNECILHARRLTRHDLGGLRPGLFRASDAVELEGRRVRIRVALAVEGDRIVADFSGTEDQVEAPLNAVFGVTYSATAFAVRCVLQSPVPTNDGFYDCVEVRAPLGSLVNPTRPAAVAAGNVETTQRIADVVLRALGKAGVRSMPADSAGTMMNVMMGGVRDDGSPWVYYETVGGGSGARADGDGISAIQTHMTNTLNTPIEVAEREYPLLFTEYRVRRGTGGEGRHRGGDGILRGFRVSERTTISVIADRFLVGPAGSHGGGCGTPARVTLVRGSQRTPMPSKFTVHLDPGEGVVLETPGGGGFGRKRTRS
jgi:N-methylhydantoinase B